MHTFGNKKIVNKKYSLRAHIALYLILLSKKKYISVTNFSKCISVFSFKKKGCMMEDA